MKLEKKKTVRYSLTDLSLKEVYAIAFALDEVVHDTHHITMRDSKIPGEHEFFHILEVLHDKLLEIKRQGPFPKLESE